MSLNLSNYPELMELIDAWPNLAVDVQTTIAGAVQATHKVD